MDNRKDNMNTNEITMIHKGEISQMIMFIIEFKNQFLSDKVTSDKLIDRKIVSDSHALLRFTRQKKYNPNKLRTLMLSKKTGKLILPLLNNMKYTSSFQKMFLVYISTFIESYLKKIIEDIFIHNPIMMKSEKCISYEELLTFESIEDLRKKLAREIAISLSYKSIDKINIFFIDKLNINFEKFKEWDEIRELTYRRNIIVHNSGIINSAYTTAIKKEFKPKPPKLTFDYLLSRAEIAIDFFDFVNKSVVDKFPGKVRSIRSYVLNHHNQNVSQANKS